MSVNQVSWITKSAASIPRIDEANGRVLLRACLETTRGAVFGEKAGWRGATKENIPGGSSTEEQRSQMAFSPKTLRAAGLLSVAGVDSFLTARCGRCARPKPPWPQPKSLAAAPLVVSKQALNHSEVMATAISKPSAITCISTRRAPKCWPQASNCGTTVGAARRAIYRPRPAGHPGCEWTGCWASMASGRRRRRITLVEGLALQWQFERERGAAPGTGALDG